MQEEYVCPLDKKKEKRTVEVEREPNGCTKPFDCPACEGQHIIMVYGLVATVTDHPPEGF